jgi:hypothetical protein
MRNRLFGFFIYRSVIERVAAAGPAGFAYRNVVFCSCHFVVGPVRETVRSGPDPDAG